MVLIAIIILVIGIAVGFAFAAAKDERDKQTGSLGQANQAKLEQKEEAKKKILELLDKQGKIANDDVQKLLSVSDATATRYLQEMSTSGIITQGQNTGRGVTYQKTAQMAK